MALKIILRLFFLSDFRVFLKTEKENIRESLCTPNKTFFCPISECLCLKNANILRIFYLAKVSAREISTQKIRYSFLNTQNAHIVQLFEMYFVFPLDNIGQTHNEGMHQLALEKGLLVLCCTLGIVVSEKGR